MTVVICMVLCLAFICTALAVVSPFPLPRTIDEVVLELEENESCRSRFPCSLYTAQRGEQQAGARSSLQPKGATSCVRVRKSTVLVIIDWVCLFMSSVSVCFLIYDVAHHGFFFRGSALPLALSVTFPLFNHYADRIVDLREL